jgi:hypothetical protein
VHGLFRPDRYEYRMDLGRTGDGVARVLYQKDTDKPFWRWEAGLDRTQETTCCIPGNSNHIEEIKMHTRRLLLRRFAGGPDTPLIGRGTPSPMTPQQFSEFVAHDVQRWARVIKYSGAVAE